MAVAVSVVARFVTGSPLWLDEALSVHISELSVGDLLDALRHDGHPPLYYLMLHGWMQVFGDGDVAVRALSGVASVATLPLAYVAGRRRGGPTVGAAVLLLAAITPFMVRYATETRMYAIVMLLVLVGWLLADDLRRERSAMRWTGLALTTGLLLLSHYWTFYLGAAAVAVLAWRWWRHGARNEAVRVGSALAAGCLLFVPWLGSFLDQLAHTGTPWASASRPTQAVVDLATGIGDGGSMHEGLLFGFVVLLLAGVGLTAIADGRSQTPSVAGPAPSVGPGRLLLDLRTLSAVRAEVVVAVATLSVGVAVGLATDATFVARYSAVFLPLILIAAGRGLAALPAPWPRAVTGVCLIGLAAVGIGVNSVEDRTQGADHAAAINEQGRAGDVVAFCPDQLGPATVRDLDDGYDTVVLPSFDPAERVDWVDYADRNATADADEVARRLLERSGDATIWMVYRGGYRTYDDFCETVHAILAAERPGARPVIDERDVFEPARLTAFPPGR